MNLPSGAHIPTSADEWSAIGEKIELHARSPYSHKDKTVLWCQGTLVLLGGALYLTSLLRRVTLNGFWCIKKDLEGYWHPNVHVAIPIVTITHAAIQTAGIALVVITDAPEGLVPTIVALNFVACSLLYFAGWTKVWAVLYALPSSIFRLRRRDVLGSTAMITKRRILSPKIFNRLILLGYLIGLLPIPWLVFTVYWVQEILIRLQSFRKTKQDLILDLSRDENSGTNLLLIMKTMAEIKNLQLAQYGALLNLRFFSGAWLTVSLSALVVFLGGSFALLLALTGQIEILSKIQKQRDKLFNLNRTSTTPINAKSKIQKNIKPEEKSQNFFNKLFHRFKTWLPNLVQDDDDDDDLLGIPTATTPPEYHLSPHDDLIKGVPYSSYLHDDSHLSNNTSRKNHKRLVNYCRRFAWQAIFCTVIATSYIVLNIFIVFNVLDAPRSISLSQLLRTIEQWAAWSWGGGPGAILGLIACVVAFSKNPILPQEPEKGPPIASDAYLDHDSDNDEDDGEPIQSRGNKSLTVEKLNLHQSHPVNSSLDDSLKPPPTALMGLNSAKSWNSLRAKFAVGFNLPNSIHSNRKNPESSSSVMSTGCTPPSPRNSPHYQLSHLSHSDLNQQNQHLKQPVTFQNGTKLNYHMPFYNKKINNNSATSSTDHIPFFHLFNSHSVSHFQTIHQLRQHEN